MGIFFSKFYVLCVFALRCEAKVCNFSRNAQTSKEYMISPRTKFENISSHNKVESSFASVPRTSDQ